MFSRHPRFSRTSQANFYCSKQTFFFPIPHLSPRSWDLEESSYFTNKKAETWGRATGPESTAGGAWALGAGVASGHESGFFGGMGEQGKQAGSSSLPFSEDDRSIDVHSLMTHTKIFFFCLFHSEHNSPKGPH